MAADRFQVTMSGSDASDAAAVASSKRWIRHDLLINNDIPYAMLEFPPGFMIQCLHGRQGIDAGREFLAPGDDW